MGTKSGVIAGIVVVLVILVRGSVFTVNEYQQAIVTRFGEIIGEPITEAGIQFKTPFVHEVTYFDKWMLHWDGDPAQVPTKDKKFILVDTTARWKIVDPAQFFKTVRNTRTALQRITGILDSATKDVVSNYNLVESVRNTNAIMEKIAAMEGTDENDEKIVGEIEPITAGREALAKQITLAAQKNVDTLGIELLDVLITRIAYVREVESKVFDRMISERNRIAEKIRATGKGEVAKIQGQLNLDLKTIESEAYKKAQSIRGKAEAESYGIYADSMSAGADFYEFVRTLEAYRKTIPKAEQIVIGTDSQFFRYLEKAK
ncbi:MAG: protease modulator HflC [Pseudobacteriovorax sp.]|nr:protease modulator HflC [Pseudobacteriovorax sp.]